MEYIHILMEENMKENGLMINNRVMGLRNGLMVQNMRDNILRERNKEKENYILQMVAFILEILRIIK